MGLPFGLWSEDNINYIKIYNRPIECKYGSLLIILWYDL